MLDHGLEMLLKIIRWIVVILMCGIAPDEHRESVETTGTDQEQILRSKNAKLLAESTVKNRRLRSLRTAFEELEDQLEKKDREICSLRNKHLFEMSRYELEILSLRRKMDNGTNTLEHMSGGSPRENYHIKEKDKELGEIIQMWNSSLKIY